MMFWFVMIISLALVLISLIAIINSLVFPRLRELTPGASPFPGKVSVLVPARNEAGTIGPTVGRLLRQEGVDFELLVLDDHSTDGTGPELLRASGGDRRLRLLAGSPLPPGWGGKNWACHQLACQAQGEWLVFTDADVRWSPGALRSLLEFAIRQEADMVAAWPTQETHSFGERLVVPLLAMVVLGYLPVWAVHHISWPVFSAANGQCLLFRRKAYDRIGGHAAVRDAMVEDMRLAWKMKSAGMRLRLVDGAGSISCRMYQCWREVRDGFAKNILAGYGNSLFFLTWGALFHWAVFLFPWLWFGLGWINPGWPGGVPAPWPTWPLALLILGVGVRALSAAATRQRVRDAIWMPISVLLMTRIAWKAILWKFRGGPVWKGRIFPG